jgi:phosphoglycolate phosphatase/putative hydrolase of the HAD superfamily
MYKIYNLPEKIKTIIFDIDGTLYTSPEYVFEQIDCQIRYYAEINKIKYEEALKLINDYREEYSIKNNGKKISLGNTLTAFGISIQESILWRNKLMFPENFLNQNDKLKGEIQKLKEKYKLVCVTNNPKEVAFKTLKAIGLEKLIPDIIALDSFLESKPSQKMLNHALEITNSIPEECISIGDRFDIDLALPLEMKMGAVLVNGDEDLIEFLKILNDK